MATSTLGSGTLVLAGTTSGTTTVTATAVAGTTTLTLPAATDTLVGKATTDTLTNKTLTGAAMNGTLGATTPSTASVTTLTTSSTITHNGGTANGVAYLNGSKVLTTGSALVFDGTNLGLGVTPSAWTTSFGFKALDIGQGCVLGATSDANLVFNAYFNTSNNWIYKTTAEAGRYQQSGANHIWYNAASGTAGNTATFSERMRIDATGDLYLGTTSGKSIGNYKFITTNATTGSGYSTQVNGTEALNLYANSGASVIQEVRNLPIIFETNGTERARIDSSGNLLVAGTTIANLGTTNKGFLVRGDNGSNVYAQIASTGTSSQGAFYFYNGNGVTGSIATSGTTTAYNTSSDYRLKQDIAPMTGALSKIAALKPCTYNWKVDGLVGEGFIAHELAEVCPQAVTGEKDAVDSEGNPKYQGIDVSFLVATLTAAIQEQQALITQLTARITALEAT